MEDYSVFKMTALPAGSVHLMGPAGKGLDKVVANRLKTVNYKKMVEPFHMRYEDDNLWRCEFWGKVTRSAVFAWRATGDAELKKLLDDTVEDMLSAQTPDGRITSYPADKQLQGWDIWGRKYVLLGLLEYYRECGHPKKVLDAAVRMLDDLLAQAGDRIQDYGWHNGLAASSILRAIVMTYQFSGEERFLDYAKKLTEAGCCHVHSIYKMALLDIPPAVLSNGKAYEMTSCFQGLYAMYQVVKDPWMLDVLVKYYSAVRDQEIFITGGGGLKDSNGEYWFYGKRLQTRRDCGAIGETCITATWMSFCRNIMEITGDSKVADEFERTLYNAMLGAISPDGSTCAHENPYLAGGDYRYEPADQISRCGAKKEFDGHDCCRAQGPYGIALAPYIAVMKTTDGYVVNLYEDLVADGVLKITGGFPHNGKVQITLEKGGDYELRLRMPAEYACKLDGIVQKPGEYLVLRRNWKAGDVIELDFDISERTVKSFDGEYTAHICGPLVMAEDSRQPGKLMPYYQAGNEFKPENTLTVWMK